MPLPPKVHNQRYGAEHRRLRRQWAPNVAAGRVRCRRCGELIGAAEPWDLGHDPAGIPGAPRHPEHREHNRATSRHRVERERAQQPEQQYTPRRDLPLDVEIVELQPGQLAIDLPPLTYWRNAGSNIVSRRGGSTW